MAGKNPYMKGDAPPPPSRPYVIRVLGVAEPIQVDPAALPDEIGQTGSILGALLSAGIDVEHVCGGVCACSTCHVYVTSGGEAANEPSDDEADMLDTAPALRATSRLACQCVPTGEADITVEIPSWNRNAVKEGH
jgi:2Fe-2S ferredoxin